jgi:hypothetical protein
MNQQMASAYNENASQNHRNIVPATISSKVNKRTSSMKDSSQQNLGAQMPLVNVQSKQNRNTLFIGGNGISGGAQYIYNNNLAQQRQNTKES